MKKCFVSLLLLAVIGVSASAQKGEKAIGLNLGYGSEFKCVAIGAKFNYGLTDNLRLSPSFNYFLGDVSDWEISADVHYLFNVSDKLAIYPLAGLTYKDWPGVVVVSGDNTYDEGDMSIGLNLGAGAGFALTDALTLGLEVKYVTVTPAQVVPSINLTYKF